jgi:outer membrane protein assembly factor BamB
MRPLRLWPGIVGATLMMAGMLMPAISTTFGMAGILSAMLVAVLTVIWWLFFSRAPWVDRILALALVAIAIPFMRPLLDRSIATGAMGYMPIMTAPIFVALVVAWAVVTRRSSTTVRRAALVPAIAVAVGLSALVRTAGMIGGGGLDLHWRWTPTPEERLLAQGNDDPAPIAATAAPASPETPAASIAPATPTAGLKTAGHVPAPDTTTAPASRAADWPGFRGPQRDGVIRGLKIDTDWAATPPVKLWQRAIGPGWSSFAVDHGLIYTQEQRGEEEIVACYRLSDGTPIWRHRDHVRFWESNGGPGPRATPTLVGGRIYALGATGLLNALDALTGAVIWSRDAVADTKSKIPMWGITSSPVVSGGVVIVALSGKLAGFDAATGAPKWTGPAHRGSYSSPQLATIDGVDQIVLLSADGVTSVSPATGAVLWDYDWAADGTPIVQPAIVDGGDILANSINGMGGLGVRRIGVSQVAGKWTTRERWTSSGLKPYFNDFVVHNGYAYGFDGSILSCIDLTDGTRKWKGGRYGSGQLVVLSDEDLLLVISEEGDLALVSATPDGFKEVAKVPGIDGKTWNHPVIVGDTLLVRNGETMAAFRLTLKKD